MDIICFTVNVHFNIYELPITTVIPIFILDEGAWVTLMGKKPKKLLN